MLIANESISKLEQQYHTSKINYINATANKNEQQKINELKNIISLGEKLKKDTTPDKKKLEILIERQNNTKKSPNSSFKI